MYSTICEDRRHGTTAPSCLEIHIQLQKTGGAHQPALNHQGTLAEWLTRGPAKLISSEACVRITQVSTQFLFAFWSATRTSTMPSNLCRPGAHLTHACLTVLTVRRSSHAPKREPKDLALSRFLISFAFWEVRLASDLSWERFNPMQRTAITSPRPSMLFYNLL
jgi:hypothetical protein